MNEKILVMKDVVKEFSGVRVLDNVNFELRAGEVHALIGANGAGKSTLMKILNGIYSLTSGSLEYNGQPVTIRSPREAYQIGISMIHQELDLVGVRDVSENIYLGRELYKDSARVVLDRETMWKQSQQLLDALGFNIDARALVSTIPPAQQQLVLIARAVSSDSKIIVMDEPTSSLSHTETQQLFKIIKDLKEKGISVIYISHYLEEIFAVADRLTVLRDGRTVVTVNTSECDTTQLVRWMIGREAMVEKNLNTVAPDAPAVIKCENLTTSRDMIHDVSFYIRRGEIVGFAGVVGSGRTEIANMVFGVDTFGSGSVEFKGQQGTFKSPIEAVRQGISMVPEDRKQHGLVLRLSIAVNTWLSYLGKKGQPEILNYKKLREKVQNMIGFMSVKCTGQDQLISALSGGNQQKIAIGKCLLNEPSLLILDQPTRGVDVGAKNEIYDLVTNLARENETAILYISDELEELLALCNRIYVIKQGHCVKELDNEMESLTKAQLLQYMID